MAAFRRRGSDEETSLSLPFLPWNRPSILSPPFLPFFPFLPFKERILYFSISRPPFSRITLRRGNLPISNRMCLWRWIFRNAFGHSWVICVAPWTVVHWVKASLRNYMCSFFWVSEDFSWEKRPPPYEAGLLIPYRPTSPFPWTFDGHSQRRRRRGRRAGRHTFYVGQRRKRGEARVGDGPDQHSVLIFRTFLKEGEMSDSAS